MEFLTIILLLFIIIGAISVSLTKNIFTSIVIFMAHSLAVCIIWVILESPDLAITEAAVGAGVTSLLFFVTLKKIHAINQQKKGADNHGEDQA